jgi:prephenate dehydratase
MRSSYSHSPRGRPQDAEPDRRHAASPYKKSKASTQTHIVFGVKSTVGALERGLAIFRAHGVDLAHIESRPAVTNVGKADYEFFVTTNADAAQIEKCVEKLKEETTHITGAK